MATYTDTSTLNTDPDDPVTSELLTALKQNPLAIAEGATDAVVNQSVWHPYDMVNVGDGNDGLFWDHSATGDAGFVTTPDFEDGYEYAIAFDQVSASGNSKFLQAQFYAETAAGYTNLFNVTANDNGGTGAGDSFTGIMRIPYPRIITNTWGVVWETPFATDGNVMTDAGDGFTYTLGLSTAQKILRARVDFGLFDGGKMYLLRRREFFTG